MQGEYDVINKETKDILLASAGDIAGEQGKGFAVVASEVGVLTHNRISDESFYPSDNRE